MERIKESVRRIREGEWFCLAPLVLITPAGAIDLTPGATYRKGRKFSGVDVGDVLDWWYSTGELPPNITLR
jgi:hypothetical protein